MCVPATNVAIQLVILINLKLPRVGYMARLAVFEAVFAVDSRVSLGEQRVFGPGLLKLGRGCGRKAIREIPKERCHRFGHGEFPGEAASTIYQIVGSRVGPTWTSSAFAANNVTTYVPWEFKASNSTSVSD